MSDEIQISNEEFLERGHETYLRHISVDCVIFGFHENELKVLLLKWNDQGPWCLPGGFVSKNESLDRSASRVLFERTGLRNIFLQQFFTFGEPGREKQKEKFRYTSKGGWLAERFISVGFYALVEFSRVSPKPDQFSEACHWWDIHSLPKLVFDHNDIFKKALDELRMSLNEHPIGYNLLPGKFTMPELQKLYETILDKRLDRRNFQKRILALKILDKLKERKTGGAHKAPFLYRFNKKRYDQALKMGLTGGF